ncbi:hypothetical protein K8S17_01630 [bacterium]|nr:hypothetical protein [bacterium]
MEKRRRSPLDVLLPSVAALALVVTVFLTYVGDALVLFRGYSLVYLCWGLLVLGVVAGMVALSGTRRRSVIVLRNITCVGGVLLIAYMAGCAVHADHMFDSWPWLSGR